MRPTPLWIESLLSGRVAALVARVMLTFPFWGSGLAKLLDFPGGMAEMRQFGLEPALAFNLATAITQLGGSALIIANRWTWLGAGALGVFTALTIPIVHHFWSLPGEQGVHAFHTAAEHVGMIGALVLVSILSRRSRPSRARAGERHVEAARTQALEGR